MNGLTEMEIVGDLVKLAAVQEVKRLRSEVYNLNQSQQAKALLAKQYRDEAHALTVENAKLKARVKALEAERGAGKAAEKTPEQGASG